MNSVAEDRHIPKSPKPAIKEVLGFDGFVGIDVKLDDGTEDKILLFRGSVNKGVTSFPPDWKTSMIGGSKMILAEVAAA